MRAEADALLDFHWTAHSPAAKPWVAGLSRALSAWGGVDGPLEPGVLREVVDGGSLLALEMHLRRGNEERWFRARAVEQGDGFERWLPDWNEAHEKQRSLWRHPTMAPPVRATCWPRCSLPPVRPRPSGRGDGALDPG